MNVPQKLYKRQSSSSNKFHRQFEHIVIFYINDSASIYVTNREHVNIRTDSSGKTLFSETLFIQTVITYITLSHYSCPLIIIETTKYEFDGCLHIAVGKLQCLNVHRVVLKTHLMHLRQLPLEIVDRRRKHW